MSFTEIPLERVERGLRFLATQPSVRTADGRVVGGSAEADAAAHRPAWPAVVAELRG